MRPNIGNESGPQSAGAIFEIPFDLAAESAPAPRGRSNRGYHESFLLMPISYSHGLPGRFVPDILPYLKKSFLIRTRNVICKRCKKE
ncbi:hypothetical protein CH380_02500 [Leptospira adleri]|uniref:Uncharacterized protein n=1 Tax=Leptospira adleri TaxID=2023186 RepID=A0A2M9YST1_9LEPT|nr:hypothetical protein CH380_02500 [Leptospira adleri]PJZ59669.1 hypothetical protein CH376_22525 [Leptospira adleri]